MKKNLSIKVTIGNRVYPLTIQPEEEESIRKAAKLVNDNIKELESNYAVRDKQDLLAMTALYFANHFVMKEDHGQEDDNEVLSRIEEISLQLQGCLKNA